MGVATRRWGARKSVRARSTLKPRQARPGVEALEVRVVPTGNFQPVGAFPAFGADSQPGIIFTVSSTGVTTTVTGQGPYDGSDDSYVGVRNLTGSGVNISSLNLSGPSGFTGFDGDGISHFGAPTSGPTGYEGPGTSYSSFTAGGTSITINFSDNSANPLTPGNQAYFSLELPPSALNLLLAVPPADQTSAEGASQPFALGSFTASGSGPWTVTVNWGDSSPNTVFTQTTKGTITPQSHPYAEEGPYTVTVTVAGNGLTSSEHFGVTVSDPSVTQVLPAAGVSAVEGAAFTGKAVAQFTDPGGAEVLANYSVVSINWGDSSPLDTTTGAITYGDGLGSKTAPFTVSGNHTYAEEGPYTITVIVKHLGDSTTTLTSTATVSDPAVVGKGVNVSAKEAIAITAPVATFMDPGGAETLANYKVNSIDWGDGTPLDTTTGVITGGTPLGSKTAVFTVSGTHTYAEEAATHTITVVIAHLGDSTTTTTSTATIRDNYGLLVLDPTDPQSLMITGNGNVTVNHSGAVVVNSSDPSAIFLAGNENATLAAAETDVTGDLVKHGHPTFLGELNHEAATPNPFDGLPLPPTGSLSVVSAAPRTSPRAP
jgi:hypothetical protein